MIDNNIKSKICLDCTKHNCGNCKIPQTYEQIKRKEYDKEKWFGPNHETNAKAFNIETYKQLLQTFVNNHVNIDIDSGMLITTDIVDELILENTIKNALNNALNIDIINIHPENQNTIWIIYNNISPDMKQMDVKLKNILQELQNALNMYFTENVDVVFDEIAQQLCIMYHDDNHSFPIVDNLGSKDDIDLKQLEQELDKLHVGHCW